MSLRLGSLFSGYGGLDLAVHQVFGDVETVWVSDIEPGPCKVLAHRFPGVPNLGDITRIDWTQVEPVDIIAGGSPCQDISSAGRMAGMRDGTRSNLWVEMREAIRVLQPTYVIWENVYAARSTAAASAMESDPRLLGDHPSGQPVLRALGRVLGDLAELGFDAEWHSLRAADIGAPHGRARYFVVAVTRDPARRAEVAGRLRGWPHRRRGVSTPHEERQEANQLGGQSHHQYDDRRSASVASHAADLWGWPLPTPGADREVSGGVALVAYREGRAQAATYGRAALLDGQAQAGGGDLGIPGASGVRAKERAGDGRLGSSDEGHRRCCKGSDHPVECTRCGCDRSDACSGCLAAHPERVARGEWRFATAGQATGGRPFGATPRRDRAPVTLLPTPAASNFNAGEDPAQWEARRQRVKETANNGNGMGMPLGIAVQLLPTPRATGGGSSTEAVELNPPRSEGYASNLLDPGLPEPGQGSNVVQEALQEMAGERVSTDSAEGGSETQACIGSVLGDGNEDGLVLAVDWSEGQQVRAREVHADGQEEHESAPLGVGGVGRTDPRRADSRSSLSGAGVREPGTPGAGDAERERQAPSSSDHSLPPGAPTVRREPLSLTSGETGVQDMPQRGVPAPQDQDWGPYRAAVERWEAVHGPAPAPTKPGRNGRPKLNPAFAEWLMGAPPGWITDVPGVTDNEALRMAGNGVVRQQAVAAMRLMLNRMETPT